MDEPTAALTAHETRAAARDHPRAGAGGTSILLISHFLREVLDLADTVTVLRDGAARPHRRRVGRDRVRR